MRPNPIRPSSGAATAQSSSSTSRPSRRRPDLTLPLPQRNTSLAVPLPLPLPLPLPPASASTANTNTNTSSSSSYYYSSSLVAPHNLYQQRPSSTPSTATSSSLPPQLSDLERVRRIGSGSGGTVWMVRHRLTKRYYALKVIYGCHDDSVRRHICREIEILRTANNPYIVGCHGMYDHAGEIQILLEYMDRGSLEGKKITSERTLAEVAAQVLQGLYYLHRRKIVHRDIKPSNLLVNSENQIKIADFGVSTILAQTMDPCNSSVGTIAYMSPERINTDLNQGSYDGYAGDIWSFGLSVLEFYLGRFPFGENVGRQGDWASLMCAICYNNPPEAPSSASWEFRNFISCCLQKEPAKRVTAARLLQHPFITQTASVVVPPHPPAQSVTMNDMLFHPPPPPPPAFS